MTSLQMYFAYRDAPAALAWLHDAFGFETTTRYDDGASVAHSEARLGDAVIIVFSDAGQEYDRMQPKSDDVVGHGAYLTVASREDVDAVWSRAVSAGAVPVWKPEETMWRNYRCRVRDLEGYEWTFGTHKPGEPQEW